MIWLPISVFYAHFEPEAPERLPSNLLLVFRSALGNALKRISCVSRKRKSCLGCPMALECAYGYLFETPRPYDAKRLKKYPYIGHPFAFLLPYPYEREKPLKVRFTLVGKARKFFPHLILALEGMAKTGLGRRRVPLVLSSVREEGSGKILYEDGRILQPSLVPPPESIQTELNEMEVRFLTPVELKFSRRFVRAEELEFHIVLRNLLRRISLVSYFHADTPLEVDFKEVIKKSQEVKVTSKDLEEVRFKRRSSRTGQTYPLRGIVGSVRFKGNLRPFFELFLLGSYLNIGKKTSFGFGAMKVLPG